MSIAQRLPAGVVAALLAAILIAAGGDGDGTKDGGKPKPLRVLVTNDDGVSAPGIDALVEALERQKKVTVVVIAPAGDRSGSGGNTTPGSPGALVATETTTMTGHEATAVEGFPADTVLYALANGKRPDFVISGVNLGQNLGPLTDISGTVGAARTAAREGIPALAVSQGLPDPPDYAAGVKQAIRWFKEHRRALARFDRGDEPDLVNLNVPTCTSGELRGVVDVPLATTTDGAVGTSDCNSTLRNPADDIQAFNNGYATLTELPVE
jgi:5'-nucleotidase